jgi:hypothetical protein
VKAGFSFTNQSQNWRLLNVGRKRVALEAMPFGFSFPTMGGGETGLHFSQIGNPKAV